MSPKIRYLFFSVAIFSVAFLILFISILRSAAVRYEFQGQPRSMQNGESTEIPYALVYPGEVIPGNPLWGLKALRDRIWLFVTVNDEKKAELLLLFADKRLGAAHQLFIEGESELGYETLTKAEKYLEAAKLQDEENRKNKNDSADFLERLAYASLKHFEVIQEIRVVAPEDADPLLATIQEYPIKTFEYARNGLQEKGRVAPKSPFEWQ